MTHVARTSLKIELNIFQFLSVCLGKNKRIMLAEQVANEPRPISVVNQNRDVERGAIT